MAKSGKGSPPSGEEGGQLEPQDNRPAGVDLGGGSTPPEGGVGPQGGLPPGASAFSLELAADDGPVFKSGVYTAQVGPHGQGGGGRAPAHLVQAQVRYAVVECSPTQWGRSVVELVKLPRGTVLLPCQSYVESDCPSGADDHWGANVFVDGDVHRAGYGGEGAKGYLRYGVSSPDGVGVDRSSMDLWGERTPRVLRLESDAVLYAKLDARTHGGERVRFWFYLAYLVAQW